MVKQTVEARWPELVECYKSKYPHLQRVGVSGASLEINWERDGTWSDLL